MTYIHGEIKPEVTVDRQHRHALRTADKDDLFYVHERAFAAFTPAERAAVLEDDLRRRLAEAVVAEPEMATPEVTAERQDLYVLRTADENDLFYVHERAIATFTTADRERVLTTTRRRRVGALARGCGVERHTARTGTHSTGSG